MYFYECITIATKAVVAIWLRYFLLVSADLDKVLSKNRTENIEPAITEF